MLDEKLKSEQYYVDKLSMFMKQSYGIVDQFSMLVYILQHISDVEDSMLEALDIVDDEVFLKLLELVDDENDPIDILDKLAHLYGMRRRFTVAYDNAGVSTKVELTLTNFELWLLIKAQILQNNFNGTYAQTREYFDKMHLPVYQFTDESTESGKVLMILNTSSTIKVGTEQRQFEITQNIIDMFRANLFTIKSMGIIYLFSYVDITHLGIWDDTSANRAWDSALWGL